ncbi:hypothetical protein ACP70R_007292 [Stipagrostis hirtigluma subsp. patula]
MLLEPDTGNIIGAAAVPFSPPTALPLLLPTYINHGHLPDPDLVTLPVAAMARILVVAVLAVLAADLCAATDHIVGANHGWNPNINYSLWSGNQTFYVGDLISFRYQKGTHNVFEVNETGYDNCTMAGVAGNWTSGKDFIPLREPRRYYFICGNGFCLQGMKVAVTVHPLPHNASAADGSRQHGGAGAQDEASAAAEGTTTTAWMAALMVAVAAAIAA